MLHKADLSGAVSNRWCLRTNQEEWYRDGYKPVVSSLNGEGRQAFWRFRRSFPLTEKAFTITEYAINVETGSGSPRNACREPRNWCNAAAFQLLPRP
ncbi:MAG: hypothetical protein K0Q90_3126 [Paenibacillaceae bacterium]|nr:hypothetical protein [Paenibacillaceae bacterium]